MSGTRWVVLDDTDDSITYRGDWFVHTDSFANQGNSGPTFRGSQHATGSSASLEFRFKGTRIRVLGTSAAQRTSGKTDPTWQCFVDGTPIPVEEPFQTHQNNWPLCVAPTLEPGEHTLTLNATSTGTPFYFDQIKYLPLHEAESQPSNATVIIEQTDPSINYLSGDWVNVNDSAKSTNDIGATLSVNFTGTGLSWIGWILEGSRGKSNAAYTIDNGPRTVFSIPQPAGPGSHYFHQLFRTPPLELGTHNLTVTYDGPNGTALALDHLLVENGEIIFFPNGTQAEEEPIPTEIASSPPPPAPSPKPAGVPIGAIVGGSLGGLFLILAFILALILIKKRMKNNLPPIPAPTFSQFAQNTTQRPRDSFSEAMVRKRQTSLHSVAPSTQPSTNGSIPAYIPMYPNPRNSAILIPEDEEFLNDQPMPSPTNTRLQPLRRHMVVPNTISE